MCKIAPKTALRILGHIYNFAHETKFLFITCSGHILKYIYIVSHDASPVALVPHVSHDASPVALVPHEGRDGGEREPGNYVGQMFVPQVDPSLSSDRSTLHRARQICV
jgi:hypothetical protein